MLRKNLLGAQKNPCQGKLRQKPTGQHEPSGLVIGLYRNPLRDARMVG